MDQFDPKSLELTSDDELLKQAILDSAGDDVPPAGARDQVLSTLKLIPEVGASAGAPERHVPITRNAYVIGLALVVGAASMSALVAMSGNEHSGPAPAKTESVRAVQPEPPEVAAPETPIPVDLLPTEEKAREPAPIPAGKPTARIGGSKSNGTTAPQESDDSTLGRELARITAARNALTSGDAARTLQLLDAYDAEFPRGTFSVEVAVLRIEALARAGRTDEAKQLGNRFLAQYPQGVLARRVATTLRSVEPHELAPASTPDR